MNPYIGRQINSRQPKSQTPPARLEQINSFKENSGEANEFEIAEEADTTSQTGRQMNRYMGKQMNWRQPESGHYQPDWETNESLYGETNEFQTAQKLDTTSQPRRQMNFHKERQMNWRQAKSRTQPARLGDK